MKLDHIILHIGPHKTGSTAIQTACHLNRGELARMGVLYPSGNWHAQLGSCFSDASLNYVYNRELLASSGRSDVEQIKREDGVYLQDLVAQIESTHCQKMILSYEGFAELEKSAVERMKAFLTTFSPKVTVVIYCRAPLSFAASAISQTVKAGRLIEEFGEPYTLRYKNYADKFVDIFGTENVAFRKFSARDMPEGDVVLDFLTFAGLTLKAIKESFAFGEAEGNESLSAEAILLGEAIMSLHPMPETANTFSVDFTPTLAEIKGQRYTLTSSAAESILLAAKPHLDYLAGTCGITFDDEAKQINDHPKLFQEQTVTAIAEQIYRLIMQIKAGQNRVAELEQHIVELSRKTDKPRLQPRIVTNGALTIIEAKLREGGKIKRGQLINFDVDFFIPNPVQNLEWSIHLQDANGDCAFSISSKSLGQPLQSLTSGSYRVSHHLIADLPSGLYRAGFAFTEVLAEGVRELAWRDAMCEFELALPESAALGGYASIPAQMSFMTTHLAMPERVVTKGLGAIVVTSPCGNLQIGQRVNVAVAISNRSAQDWLGDVVRPIKLCYHWLKASGEMYLFDGVRSSIPAGGIASGVTVQAEMQVQAPAEIGSYILVVTLLQERVGWFESIGFETVKLSIEVSA